MCALYAFIFLAASAINADIPSLSVWEQMRLKGVNSVKTVIESVEVSDQAVIVGYKDGDIVKQSKLCQDQRNEPFYSMTNQNQRVEMLRSALKSGDKVELAFQGPWNPCLQSVKASR